MIADPADRDPLVELRLAEGRVVSVGTTPKRDYLDFGRVWKDDVTATIGAKALRLFSASNIDPLAFKGKRVRLRGWIEDHDGPSIEIESPAQIEVVESR